MLHDAQQISAEDFADIFVLVTFAHQSLGDFWELGTIFHSVGHRCAVEIGAQTDVVRTDEFHNMVDVLDDCFPTHARQSSGSVHLRLEVFQFAADAVFIPRAFLGNLLRGSHDAAGNSVVGLFVGLVDKAALVVDLNHATFGSQRLDHVVGHVPRMIAEGAAGRVRSNQRSFADFQGVKECFVTDMRNVHHDSLTVHFANDVLAEIGEAVVRGLVGGGVGPLVVVEMREGHVARAQVAEHA